LWVLAQGVRVASYSAGLTFAVDSVVEAMLAVGFLAVESLVAGIAVERQDPTLGQTQGP